MFIYLVLSIFFLQRRKNTTQTFQNKKENATQDSTLQESIDAPVAQSVSTQYLYKS